MSPTAVVSRGQLEAIFADLETVIDLAARYPMSPFRSDGGYFWFCEYEEFCGGRFGPLLKGLADRYGDRTIVGSVIEPPPEILFNVASDEVAAFRLSASTIDSTYADTMTYVPSEGSSFDILMASHVLAVAGSSGQWAVWGERLGWGIAVLWTADADSSWLGTSQSFVTAVQAFGWYAEPNFLPEEMPSLRGAFMRSFGRRAGLLKGRATSATS